MERLRNTPHPTRLGCDISGVQSALRHNPRQIMLAAMHMLRPLVVPLPSHSIDESQISNPMK